MIQIYTQRGMSVDDAEAAIAVLSRYPDVFVDLMMTQELGLAVVSAASLRAHPSAPASAHSRTLTHTPRR